VKLRGIMCLIALTSLVLFSCTSIPAATLDAYAASDIQTVKASAVWMTNTRIDTALLPKGTILLFTTAEGNLGKMLIVTGSRQSPMQFMYTVYKADGSILKESKKASVAQTYAFDLKATARGPCRGRAISGGSGRSLTGEAARGIPSTWFRSRARSSTCI
jgi:hypothetical protein